MSKPQPEPIDESRLVSLAEETMRSAKFPILASMDGDQARARPVSPVRTQRFVVHVANLRQYHKTIELAANPKLELCYMSPEHDQVRLTGVAHIEKDPALLKEIWESNPLLRSYLGSIDNPALIVYRIEPVQVRFMREWALEYYEVPFQS